MKVYVVFGQTGEYSDHADWPARGFMSSERAEAFEFECTKAAKDFEDRRRVAFDDPESDWDDSDEIDAMRAEGLDPGFRRDYTGTDYYTVEVEVEP
jgi:hypothetical protein